MFYKRIVVLGLVVLTVLAFAAPIAAGGSRNFRAHLNGDDAGVDTLAQGQAIFKFNADGTLTYRLNVANIDGVIMAHIHLYTTAAGGPPVVWLIPDGPPPLSPPLGRTNGRLVEGTVDASRLVGPLAGMSLEDLRQAMADGRTFVNVHTADNPGGEIRGDIH